MQDVGNRQEYEQLVDDGDTSIALFFLEFARLWAIKQPWPVTPLPTDDREGDAPEQQGKVLIDQAELTALRDMAWRYQARSEQQS
jgi:hypothetical protein